MLHVAPDARDDWPVITEVALASSGALPAVASARVDPSVDAPAVAQGSPFATPAALRGALDVAWAALGGKTDQEHMRLISGVVDGTSTALLLGQPVNITLAGSGAQRVLAVSLTPPPSSSMSERLRTFRIAASSDGATFQALMQGKLSPLAREQVFFLPAQISTRYLQITALDRQGEPGANKALLSQFKVLADPLGSGFPPFDLGRPEFGGHIVWTNPQPDFPVTGDSLFWPGKSAVTFPPDRKVPIEWVMGFRSDRLAQLSELTWRSRGDTPPAARIQAVTVEVSTATPFGPWTSLGQWKLQPAADGMAHFKLPQAQSIRYVHFANPLPATGHLVLPDGLGALETPSSNAYRSILGQWDAESHYSGVSATPAITGIGGASAASHVRANAALLAPGSVAQGVVRLGQSTDWYRLQLPAPTRQLIVQITGTPAPAALPRVEDAQGRALALVADPNTPGKYSAPASAGAYWMQVAQPPHSVIVAWDTSTSVNGFSDGIERVVRRLSHDIVAGQEEVNLVPFRGPASQPLLDHWAVSAAEIYGPLSAYPWSDNSSDAESALISANKAFASRPGEHAVALITDAQSSSPEHTAELWRGLAAQRPTIFALKIPSQDSPEKVRAQMNLMQDWAYSGGGFYDLFVSQGDADVQFRRMAAWLHRPAAYGVSYAIGTTPPPPGRLIVRWAQAGASSAAASTAPAVAIVVDASGSMLQRIGGVPKIEIEKELLHTLVNQTLPAKTPVMLRVFGQGGKGSCRTDLIAPLAPLDPKRFSALIATIRSTNGAKTAIADSLRLTASDLTAATGARQVVLITDGGEDCGGDPGAEIAKLHASGFDVQMNIVGFAVDTPATKALFEKWAKLGGGHYFDAGDRNSLDTALHQAFAQAVDAVGADGKVVAQGAVGGDPISLPSGSYTLRLVGAHSKELGAVQIAPGQTTTIDVNP